MAGINEFMIFDENNQNSMTNETYSTDEQRLNGVASGIARSSLYNKALRQATKMSKELGLFLSQKGNDVTEDSDIAGMLQEAISKDGLGLSEYLYMTDAGIRSKDDWNYVSECNPGYAFFDSSNYFIFNDSTNSEISKKATTVISNKSNIICAKIFSKLTEKYMIISSSDGGKTWVKRIESDDPMMLLYDERRDYFYAITSESTHRKSTNGTNWKTAASSPSYSKNSSRAKYIQYCYAANNVVIYTCAIASNGINETYISLDGGNSFESGTIGSDFIGGFRLRVGYFYSNTNNKWYKYHSLSNDNNLISGETTTIYVSGAGQNPKNASWTSINIDTEVKQPIAFFFDIKKHNSSENVVGCIGLNGYVYIISSNNSFQRKTFSYVNTHGEGIAGTKMILYRNSDMITFEVPYVIRDGNNEYISFGNNLYYFSSNTIYQVGNSGSGEEFDQIPYESINPYYAVAFYFNYKVLLENKMRCMFYGSIFEKGTYQKYAMRTTSNDKKLSLGKMFIFEEFYVSLSSYDATIACNGAPIIGLVSTIYDAYGKPELYTKGILRKIETSASVQPNNYYMFSENKIMRIVSSDTYKEENATFSLIEIMS